MRVLPLLFGIMLAAFGALVLYHAAPYLPAIAHPVPWPVLAIIAATTAPAAAVASRLFNLGDKILATDQVVLKKRDALVEEVHRINGIAKTVLVLIAVAAIVVIALLLLVDLASLPSFTAYCGFGSFLFTVVYVTWLSFRWNDNAVNLISRLEKEKQKTAFNAGIAQRLKRA